MRKSLIAIAILALSVLVLGGCQNADQVSTDTTAASQEPANVDSGYTVEVDGSTRHVYVTNPKGEKTDLTKASSRLVDGAFISNGKVYVASTDVWVMDLDGSNAADTGIVAWASNTSATPNLPPYLKNYYYFVDDNWNLRRVSFDKLSKANVETSPLNDSDLEMVYNATAKDEWATVWTGYGPYVYFSVTNRTGTPNHDEYWTTDLLRVDADKNIERIVGGEEPRSSSPNLPSSGYMLTNGKTVLDDRLYYLLHNMTSDTYTLLVITQDGEELIETKTRYNEKEQDADILRTLIKNYRYDRGITS